MDELPPGWNSQCGHPSWGNHNANNSGVNIYNMGKVSYIILAVCCGLAIGVGAIATMDAIRSERETRMLEYYVMENDGKLVKAGIIAPEDTWSAQKQRREKAK